MSSSRQQQRLKMKKHLQAVSVGNKEDEEAWDSDGSLSWEDFFGNSSTTDLVPTLLGMYDALIGRADADNTPKDNGKSQSKTQKQESSEVPSDKFPANPDPPPPPAEPPPVERQKDNPAKDSPEASAENEGRSLPTMEEMSQPWKEMLGNCPEPHQSPDGPQQLPYHRCKGNEERPLSVTSTASSSSTTSSSSSSSGGRDGGRSKSCAYLASVESLGDDEMSLGDDEEGVEKGKPRKGACSSVASIDDRREGTDKCAAGSVDSGAANGFSCGANRVQRGHHSYPHHHSLRDQHLLGGGGRRLFLSHNQSNSAATTSNKSSSGVSSVTSSSSSSSSYSSFPTATCSHISPPSLPTGPKPRYCDPNLSYMDRVVMEIAETEAIYVRDLQQVIEGYLHRWRSSSDCPIGSRQLQDLFGNIEDIYFFNSEFLCELQQCGMDPVKVAKTFVKNNSGFSIYTEYCTNYPRTVSVLTELMRQEMTVRLFRERQAALQHTLPLGSYLLKPVQRILKYHLLLQNIVKHFGKDTEGYRDIADALSAMTGIAHHINEMKRRHEHAIRVQEIQSLLYGWEGEDLTTYGELCAEGAFRMHGAKALRHAFLFDRMLLLTKRKEEGMLTYKAHILCSNLMLIESIPGEPLSFHVIPFDNPRLQYTLQARNLEQKREWTLQLKRVILENYNAVIPTHARQLVMELGQNRTDDEIMAEKSAPKKQHSAPEYLERRKQERRKSETGLLLRTRLRRSHRKEGTVVMPDGLSYEEQSPTVYRRGRRAQSVSQDRSEICSRGLNNEDHRAGTLPSTAEKVKDRFGSWRRKSEPSYSSKSNSSIGHLSIYVSPDFIERSTDSLINGERKADISMEEQNRGNKHNVEVDSQNEHIIKMKDGPPKSEKTKPAKDEMDSETNDEKEDGGSHEESLEEIVGQLVMQSHQFQRMLMRHHRRAQGSSSTGGTVTSRSRNHSRENQRTGETSPQDTAKPQNEEQYEQPSSETCTHNSGGVNHNNTLKQSMSTFRAQRQAHMRALRQEQRVSVILNQNKNEAAKEESSHCDNSTPYITLTFDNGILKTADGVSMEGITNEEASNHQINKKEGYLGNYDNLQNVWESVRQAEKEMKAVSPDSSFGSQKEENLPWPSPRLEPCIPTLPAVWLKQQEGHLAIPSLKSGSLPRGFQLGRPQQQAHRCTTFEVAYPSSTLPHFEGSGNNDEGYPSSLFRMERPFTIASESPGRADEIDFEDIEQYMAETGRTGTGMSFLPSRFPLPPLQDGQEVCQEEEDEEEEENSSTAHIHVHPEYRIYRPSVSRAALRHVISSVSSKLANFRASAASGGVTTEDEEEEREMEDLVGEVREKSNQRGRTRRRIGNSCPNSLDSNDVYRSGHVSGGDSESDVVKGGSRLVYTLARHYSRSLKERIRSIMTMNVVGMGNIDQDDQDFKGCELEGQSSDHFVSQDNLSNRTSPVKTPTTPPVTYHKQGSSSLGARIAHGGELPEYATPNIRGVNDKTKENLSSRPDSLLSETSAFTSSSNGDKVHEDRASASISKPGPPCDESNSDRKICEYEEEEEYCGGSGDSYYERSFEAIESFLGDPGMGCTIIGDTYRDSAIFSDHEEVDILVSRASENCKTLSTPQKGSSTTNRSKIPPPVPAKPTAYSIAASNASLANPDRIGKELPHLDSVKVLALEKENLIKEEKEHNGMGGSPVELQTHLMGIKSVQERMMELEKWKSSTDVSGSCTGNNETVEDVSKHVRQNGEGYVEIRKLVDCDAIDSARDSENGNDGVTMPKGWVRHVIGKLQGD